MSFSKMYGHLPPAFQPHDFAERGARTKWRTSIHQILPTLSPSSLPPGLELRSPGHHYQPPRFNFGWKLSAEQLSALAQRHGFFAVSPSTPASPTSLSSPSTSGTTGDHPFDTVRMTILLNSLLPSPSSSSSTSYVRIDALSAPPARHNRNDSGSSTLSSSSNITIGNRPSPPSKFYCLTLADNHRSGNQVPRADAIEELRRFLGLDSINDAGDADAEERDEEGEPRWHLDQKWCNWQWKRSDEVLLDERRLVKALQRTQ